MSKQVTLYSTSATGLLQTKKHISSIKNLLEAYKIPYEVVKIIYFLFLSTNLNSRKLTVP